MNILGKELLSRTLPEMNVKHGVTIDVGVVFFPALSGYLLIK